MVFNKRERYAAIGLGVVLGLLLLDSMVLEPFLDRRREIAREVDDASRELQKAQTLFKQRIKLRKVLEEMNAGGLDNSPSDAVSQLQLALDEWAQECGVNVSSLKEERTSTENKFTQIGFHLTGTGPLSAISTLLWRLETTTMPLRITEIQITPRHEGQDDLQLQLAVSTLCRASDDRADRLRTASSRMESQ